VGDQQQATQAEIDRMNELAIAANTVALQAIDRIEHAAPGAKREIAEAMRSGAKLRLIVEDGCCILEMTRGGRSNELTRMVAPSFGELH